MGAQGTDFRRDKASALLTYWAYRMYTGRDSVEQGAHATGGNPISTVNPARPYNTVGFKMKTNAKQDRPPGKSSIPLGGVMRTETNERRAFAIDKLISEKLSPRARLLAFYLFLPRTFLTEDPRNLTDRAIAIAADYNPKRASEIKQRAITLVANDLLAQFID